MTVYVPNDYSHTATDAEKWGRLVYLTTGPIERLSVLQHNNAIKQRMVGSRPTDFIVVCGLSIVTALAVGVFMHRHGRANLLIWDKGKYEERRVFL